GTTYHGPRCPAECQSPVRAAAHRRPSPHPRGTGVQADRERVRGCGGSPAEVDAGARGRAGDRPALLLLAGSEAASRTEQQAPVRRAGGSHPRGRQGRAPAGDGGGGGPGACPARDRGGTGTRGGCVTWTDRSRWREPCYAARWTYTRKIRGRRLARRCTRPICTTRTRSLWEWPSCCGGGEGGTGRVGGQRLTWSVEPSTVRKRFEALLQRMVDEAEAYAAFAQASGNELLMFDAEGLLEWVNGQAALSMRQSVQDALESAPFAEEALLKLLRAVESPLDRIKRRNATDEAQRWSDLVDWLYQMPG